MRNLPGHRLSFRPALSSAEGPTRLLIELLQLLQDRFAPHHDLIALVRTLQADREDAFVVDLLDHADGGDPVARPDRGGEPHVLCGVLASGAQLEKDCNKWLALPALSAALSLSAKMILFLALLLFSSACTPPVAILEISGYRKLPIRVAAIISKDEKDWVGRQWIKDWLGYKIETPLRCYDSDPRTFRQRPGGQLEPVHEPRFEIFVSTLRGQAERTFRENLPLFFEHVDILTDPPQSLKGYDLILRPKVLRWPLPSDPPSQIQVEYALLFQMPKGETLVQPSAIGTAEAIDYDPRKLLNCDSIVYSALKSAYIDALARAQAHAIGAIFATAAVDNALRNWAERIRR